jgi:hypothetical protein
MLPRYWILEAEVRVVWVPSLKNVNKPKGLMNVESILGDINSVGELTGAKTILVISAKLYEFCRHKTEY